MRSYLIAALLASVFLSSNTVAQDSVSSSVAVPSSAVAIDTLSIEQVRAIVRDEIRKNPKLILDAVNAYTAEEQKNKESADRQTTLDNKALITVSAGYPSFGNSEGSVSLFYFYDVNCTYCKKLEPALVRFVADNPDVKLVLREMPILADSSHYAAQIGGVLAEVYPESYPKFHAELMALKPGMTNGDIDRTVVNVLGPVKGPELLGRALQVDSDYAARAVAERISATLETASKAKINGTPFVFVGGSDGMLRGASDTAYDDLSMMVRDARALANK